MKFLFLVQWMLIRKGDIIDRGTKGVVARDGTEAWRKVYSHEDVPAGAKCRSITEMGQIDIL